MRRRPLTRDRIDTMTDELLRQWSSVLSTNGAIPEAFWPSQDHGQSTDRHRNTFALSGLRILTAIL